MSKKHILWKNIQKNAQHYFLYVFALTFSVALYFTFVTLQYDTSLDMMNELVEGPAAIRVGSIFLIGIVTIFIIYANNLFLKRRSKEIGLYQLVGMTRGHIFTLLSMENIVLYMSGFIIGVCIGFSFSKLLMMILFTVVNIEAMTTLQFSWKAFVQTFFVFISIFIVILMMNGLYLRKQNILTLFQKEDLAEENNEQISVWTIVLGVLGLIFMGGSYVLASKLFSGDFSGNTLFVVMFAIVFLLSVGTYFFFKGSIASIFHFIRHRQNGHVSVHTVLSVSTIMFRMKSHAFLLTIITLLSTIAISLTSIAYIAYDSAEKTAKEMVPHHFSLFTEEDVEQFTMKLEESDIPYTVYETPIEHEMVDIREALEPGSFDQLDISEEPEMQLAVISDVTGEVHVDEVLLTKPDDLLMNMLDFKDEGSITIHSMDEEKVLSFTGLQEESVLPERITNGFPVVIVHEKLFHSLANHQQGQVSGEFPLYIGVEIDQNKHISEANDIFHVLHLGKWDGIWTGFESQLDIQTAQKQGMGLMIFITGFLGCIFLLTSGCVLYFKQMEESMEDQKRYTILRKLGFSYAELMKGIYIKQVLNFGIPLMVGLMNSYFVIKSGWFIFGKSMWTPMLIVMGVYSILYSIFAILSIRNDQQLIRESL